MKKQLQKLVYEVCSICLRILMIPFDPLKIKAGFQLLVDQGLYPESAYKTFEKELEKMRAA
jgi:hypothetical protein